MARSLARKRSVALAGLTALTVSCGGRTGLRGTLADAAAPACAQGDGGTDGGCLPTSCAQGVCITQYFFTDITDVAADGTNLYSTSPNLVMKTSACGSGYIDIGTCGVKPDMIAVDDVNIYFTTVAGTLQSVSKQGGVPSVLATFDGEAMGLAASAGVVYWTARDPSSHAGELRSIPTTGGSPTTLFSGPIDAGLAVDASFVYWGSDRTLLRANLDGSGVNTLQGNQAIASITVDATAVYWTDGCGRLTKMPKDLGPGSFLVVGGGSCIDAKGHLVAVDDTHAYWLLVQANGGSLLRANLDGSGQTQLMQVGVTPTAVALDATRVYFGDREQLMSLSK